MAIRVVVSLLSGRHVSVEISADAKISSWTNIQSCNGVLILEASTRI